LCRYRTALSDRHKNVTWPDFVSAVLGKDGYDNIHWRPQSHFCGLQRFSALFTFAGNFEQLRGHGEQLIAQAGLEEASELHLRYIPLHCSALPYTHTHTDIHMH
jgi:hypothetical protein